MKIAIVTLVLSMTSAWAANTGVVADMWNMEQTPVNEFLAQYDCRNSTQFVVSAKEAKCSQDICVVNVTCQRKLGAKTKDGATPTIEITGTCGSNNCSDLSACLHDQSVTSIFGNAQVTKGRISNKQPTMLGEGVK